MFHHAALLVLLMASSVHISHAVRQVSINLDGDKTMQATTPNLSICSKDIVDETGELIDNQKNDDMGYGICSKNEVQELLAAGPEAMNQFWKTLNLPDEPSCQAVCKAVASELDHHGILPPRSDLGCILLDGKMDCDIDLSEASIRQFANFKGDLPDFHDKDVMTEKEQKEEVERKIQKKISPKMKDQANLASDIAQEARDLLQTTANLFRFFPPSATSFVASAAGAGASLVELHGSSKKLIDYQKDVMKTVETAKFYLSNTIKKFKKKKTEESINRWFGPGAFQDESGRRNEVKRLLKAVKAMLGNAAFVYPGQQCSAGTYAYVYPRNGSSVRPQCDGKEPVEDEKCVKNSEGQYMIYLCPLYLKRPNETIEVLLHEGSHHASAFTDDVCMDDFYNGWIVKEVSHTVNTSKIPEDKRAVRKYVWIKPPDGYPEETFQCVGANCIAEITRIDTHSVEVKFLIQDDEDDAEPWQTCNRKAYGRKHCKALARLSPAKAIKNADNLCYYISDVSRNETDNPISDDSPDCIKTGRFCVGDTVKYLGKDKTDEHDFTIRTNAIGLVLYLGNSRGQSPLEGFDEGDLVEVNFKGDGVQWKNGSVSSTDRQTVKFEREEIEIDNNTQVYRTWMGWLNPGNWFPGSKNTSDDPVAATAENKNQEGADTLPPALPDSEAGKGEVTSDDSKESRGWFGGPWGLFNKDNAKLIARLKKEDKVKVKFPEEGAPERTGKVSCTAPLKVLLDRLDYKPGRQSIVRRPGIINVRFEGSRRVTKIPEDELSEMNASGYSQSNVSDVRQANEIDSSKSMDDTSDLDAELLDTTTAAPETNASGDNQS
eukprot:TRINITY_DN1819_c0_g1_i3.p1 TRINITY_DN1819_c0_g1~~TRINITY_DN1819_c0_g1_i3.p1  ORF type:complete len:830 (-),score=147.94 TRINITY_DN1819_c0_g1_i3:109-2598(-)